MDQFTDELVTKTDTFKDEMIVISRSRLLDTVGSSGILDTMMVATFGLN